VSAPADPGVDVVVPCYNGARYLARTLDSALAQAYAPLRVLVVDDGSTDESRRIVERYRGRVGYVHKENGGQASARNLGIARTRGAYVCLLDADDILAPTMVARLVERLEGSPDADFAHSPPLAFFGRDEHHLAAEHWRPAVDWGSYREPLSILCAIHGSATVFRRRTFDRFGLFPEARALQGCEDWHFWLQAVLKGAVVAYVPDVLCLYRKHLGSSSASRSGIARRETELMRAARGLFDRHGVQGERDRAVLAAGMASVAGRWLALEDAERFGSLMAEARDLAPRAFGARHLEPLRALGGRAAARMLQVGLAEALLEMGQTTLASVVFLRCRSYGGLRAQAGGAGMAAALERVAAAAAAVVASELAASGAARGPSYATHLAAALAEMEQDEGRPAAARERLEEALRLDPHNAWASVLLAGAEARRGRLGRTLAHVGHVVARRRALVPSEIARWVAGRWRGPGISPGGPPSPPPPPDVRPA
jgi:GT2 family glycosyltransferase